MGGKGKPYVVVLLLEPACPDPELGASSQIRSTVTTDLASTEAGRNVTGETSVPRRSRLVRAASAASVAQASSEPAGSPRTIER